MPVTPNLGLPYAVGTEFATDYPATVDEPRALLLDDLLGANAIRAGVTFAGGPVPAGWLTMTGGTPDLGGGITHNPSTGEFTLPRAGTYLACCQVATSSVGPETLQPGISVGAPGAPFLFAGPLGAPSVGGGAFELVWQFDTNAGGILTFQANATGPLTITSAFGTIHFLGEI